MATFAKQRLPYLNSFGTIANDFQNSNLLILWVWAYRLGKPAFMEAGAAINA